jgi:hypothetical protein
MERHKSRSIRSKNRLGKGMSGRLMEPKTIIVKERIRGTRGGFYVYVLEGRELVHISHYAVRKLSGKYEDEVNYEVPINNVAGKVLYCFDFSRSGGAFLCKCRIEDFEDGRPKRYEYFELLEKRVDEIRNLRFQIENPKLISLLKQFEQVFTPMIREVQEYERTKNFEISFMEHEERLATAFKKPDVYYFEFMSLPYDRARINSLRVTRRWIYQIWVLKLLCDAVQMSRFKGHEYEGRPCWWIKQGSELSTAIGESPFGVLTLWLEFQPSKYAHMVGMIAGRRVPIRPDIVLVKGYFERTEDFVESKKPIELIVECKEDPYNEWKSEIQSQIIPYQENFKPDNFILASLEQVPDATKRMLENRGINVIDNLRPHSENIKTLSDFVKRALQKSSVC